MRGGAGGFGLVMAVAVVVAAAACVVVVAAVVVVVDVHSFLFLGGWVWACCLLSAAPRHGIWCD